MQVGPKCADVIECRFCDNTNARASRRSRESIHRTLKANLPHACGLNVPQCIVQLLFEFTELPQDCELCIGYGKMFDMSDGQLLMRRVVQCPGRRLRSWRGKQTLNGGEIRKMCCDGLSMSSWKEEDDELET